MIPTGLFTRTIHGYDEWLNRYNPYDDEYDEELEEHLEKMREMDNIVWVVSVKPFIVAVYRSGK